MHSTDNLCSSPLLFAVALQNKRSFFGLFFFPPLLQQDYPHQRKSSSMQTNHWSVCHSTKTAKKPTILGWFYCLRRGIDTVTVFQRMWCSCPARSWSHAKAPRLRCKRWQLTRGGPSRSTTTTSNRTQGLHCVEMSPINRAKAYNR